MPRQQKKQNSEEAVEWNPDFDRIFSVKNGFLFIGGELQSAEVLQELKHEAQNLRHFAIIDIIANTIANEAARFALEEAKVGEPDSVRSNKLAFAQALSSWNKHVWTNLELLRKK